MKKLLITIFISILLITNAFAKTKAQVLRLEEPEELLKKKNILQMNVENLKEIISDYKLEGLSATIQFTDTSGQVFAKLAKVKRGKLKWAHKVVNNEILNVKFKKPDSWINTQPEIFSDLPNRTPTKISKF